MVVGAGLAGVGIPPRPTSRDGSRSGGSAGWTDRRCRPWSGGRCDPARTGARRAHNRRTGLRPRRRAARGARATRGSGGSREGRGRNGSACSSLVSLGSTHGDVRGRILRFRAAQRQRYRALSRISPLSRGARPPPCARERADRRMMAVCAGIPLRGRRRRGRSDGIPRTRRELASCGMPSGKERRRPGKSRRSPLRSHVLPGASMRPGRRRSPKPTASASRGPPGAGPAARPTRRRRARPRSPRRKERRFGTGTRPCPTPGSRRRRSGASSARWRRA